MLQDVHKELKAMAFNSPVSTTPVPRQGVAAAAFPNSQVYLSQFGSWAGIWYPYDGVYPCNFQLVPMLTFTTSLPTVGMLQRIAAEKDHE